MHKCEHAWTCRGTQNVTHRLGAKRYMTTGAGAAEARKVPESRSLIQAWVVSEEYILGLSNGLTIYKPKTVLKIKINLNLVFILSGSQIFTMMFLGSGYTI